MILAALLGKPRGLKALALSELGMSMTPIEALIGPAGKGQLTMDQVPVEQVAPYAAADAVATRRLFDVLYPKLTERERWLYEEVERPLTPIVAQTQVEGIALDEAALLHAREAIDGLYRQQLEVVQALLKDEDFNPGSPKQVTEALDTEDAQTATLLEDGRPAALAIVRAKHLSKLLSSYIRPLERMGGRAYGSFNQVGTDTGRFSASGWKVRGEPWGINLQTIPRGEEGDLIRRCFVPDEGCEFLEVDFSQIELRMAAHIAPEAAMLGAYRAGRDIHNEMMDRAGLDDRRAAKILNFGMLYEPVDASAVFVVKRLFATQGLSIAEETARGYVALYRRAWPDLRTYYRRIQQQVTERGWVETILGRRLRGKFAMGRDRATYSANQTLLKQMVNQPIQGSAADAFKLAWVRMAERAPGWLTWKVPVHDSWLVQVPRGRAPEAYALMKETCLAVGKEMGLSVPLLVEGKSGPNWGEMHAVWETVCQ